MLVYVDLVSLCVPVSLIKLFILLIGLVCLFSSLSVLAVMYPVVLFLFQSKCCLSSLVNKNYTAAHRFTSLLGATVV